MADQYRQRGSRFLLGRRKRSPHEGLHAEDCEKIFGDSRAISALRSRAASNNDGPVAVSGQRTEAVVLFVPVPEIAEGYSRIVPGVVGFREPGEPVGMGIRKRV